MISDGQGETLFGCGRRRDENATAWLRFELLYRRITLKNTSLPVHTDGAKVRQLPPQPIDIIREGCPDDNLLPGIDGIVDQVQKNRELARLNVIGAIDEGRVRGNLNKAQKSLERRLGIVENGLVIPHNYRCHLVSEAVVDFTLPRFQVDFDISQLFGGQLNVDGVLCLANGERTDFVKDGTECSFETMDGMSIVREIVGKVQLASEGGEVLTK